MTDQPFLTWKGRRVRSPGDSPETVARKVPEATRPGSLFFVPSPLEGWGVDVLLDRLSNDSVVVWFEKDAELAGLCAPAWTAFLGPKADDPRLFRLQTDTEEAVQELFKKLPLHRLRRCEWLALGGSWLSEGPRYREVFRRFEQGLSRWWSNRITSVHMGPLWVRNLFDNLGALLPAHKPWPHWGSATVIVCGAGVSLEALLPWAKEHRSYVKLLAVDTALPILKDWDLVPDAVVCVESQHANLRDFAGWKDRDVPLFADLTAHPSTTRVFSQSPYWFVSRFAELGLWSRWPWSDSEIPQLPPLGSVGVAAAWIAWRLTEGQVVLAGLDFSFPPGKTHARGAPSLAALAARTDRLHALDQPVWNGALTRPAKKGWLTTPVMEGYSEVLADQARPEAGRTRVVDDRGLVPLPVWDHLPGAPSPTDPGQQPRPWSKAPEAWLAEERIRWKAALEVFVRLNASDPAAEAELREQLEALDYLTFVFPDPRYRADSDWLIRAQAQIRWVLNRTDSRSRSLD